MFWWTNSNGWWNDPGIVGCKTAHEWSYEIPPKKNNQPAWFTRVAMGLFHSQIHSTYQFVYKFIYMLHHAKLKYSSKRL